MTELVSSVADKIDRAVQRVTPFAYRVRRTGRRWVRRALRKPRSVSEGPNLLPLLIQVLASFSKADGVLLEEEIDSSLGFLRYDYPEAVYSELRQLFRQALYEQQDLAAMAQKLGAQLSADRKIMLGVQLYDLISQAGLKQEQVVAFYSFMSQMGMAAQAIDIVYQLNASEDSDEVELERSRTRESALRVTFGLNVRVKALRDVNAELNGVRLKAGTQVEATLEDRIVFHNDSELDLSDLRRRARALGGRFQLKASKSEYLVSNDPSRLEPDDILLSPGTSGDVVLKIFCDYDQRVGQLEVIEADRPIMVGGEPVRTTAQLKDGDTIRIDVGQVLRCNFSERIIEEERNIIRTLEVNEVTHRFGKGEIGLEGNSFSVTRGELVCVMGASGSGKSTLMRVLAGQLQPTSGDVILN